MLCSDRRTRQPQVKIEANWSHVGYGSPGELMTYRTEGLCSAPDGYPPTERAIDGAHEPWGTKTKLAEQEGITTIISLGLTVLTPQDLGVDHTSLPGEEQF